MSFHRLIHMCLISITGALFHASTSPLAKSRFFGMKLAIILTMYRKRSSLNNAPQNV